jgi:hypothetical protein
MCPFCLATAAMIAGGIAGTGGLAAVVTGVIVGRKFAKQIPRESAEKESHYGNDSRDCNDAA